MATDECPTVATMDSGGARVDRFERAYLRRLGDRGLTHRTEFRVSILANRPITKAEMHRLLNRRFPWYSTTEPEVEVRDVR